MPKLSCALLVDDDPTTNYLNQLLLKRMDAAGTVLTALNGREALDLLPLHCQEATESCPALILLDVKMPVMDGFEFLRAFDQLPLTQKSAVVIVMLTTSLHPQDVERVKQFNVAGFLNKPLTQEKVNDILRQYFAGREISN